MATSPHLAGKLRDALGADAGMELVHNVDKAMNDIRELRADVAELRHEMQVGFARTEQSFTSVRAELAHKVDLAQLAAMEARLTTEIASVRSDLMKWSFVFWVGAVAAIAMLAGVLR